jgi:hypothetical protein
MKDTAGKEIKGNPPCLGCGNTCCTCYDPVVKITDETEEIGIEELLKKASELDYRQIKSPTNNGKERKMSGSTTKNPRISSKLVVS